MTTPSKLDEARLRELINRLMGPHEWGYRCPVEGGFITDNAPFDFASELINALSAERERGDRAVGLIEALADYASPFDKTGEPLQVRIAKDLDRRIEMARAFLATQKAEGAHD